MTQYLATPCLLLCLLRRWSGTACHIILSGGMILSSLFCFVCPVAAQDVNIDSLKQLLKRQEGTPRIETLNRLAAEHVILGLDSSIQYATRAFQLANNIGESESIIKSEYQLGILYVLKKSDTLAFRHLKHALDEAESLNDPYLIAEGYMDISRYHQRTNAYGNAINYLNDALHISEQHNFKEQTARIYLRLGSVYKAIGSYQHSLNNFLKALRIYEQMNNASKVAAISNDVGTVYQRTGDFDDGLDYFNRALKINESLHDKDGLAGTLLNIGVIHQKKHNYDEALQYYFKVLPMTRELNDPLLEAIITGNIGSTMVSQGKLTEGLEYLNKALALKEKIDEPKNALHTLNDIADAKLRLHDPEGAKQAAERVVAGALRYGESDQLRYGYLNLSKSYRQADNYEKAYYFLEKYNAVNDSLFGIEKAQQIKELEIQYETEKKDMAINSLEQEKAIATAQRKIYILVGAIIALVLAGLYINQRLKTKRNRELLEKEREVDRLKSDFFANISHEFRTPLSLILGPIETLLSKLSDPNHRFQLNLMRKSASRLLRLINQILDLSKLQFGRLELKVTEFNAVKLIKGVSATFESLLESKGIRLNFKSSDENVMLYGDQEQIETICINLISNAIKFSDEGGVITVQLNRVGPSSSDKNPEGELELQITDNGIGIPAEQVEHIFDRFYQAGSASEKRYGGTGIGLALTKELVELHHGNISVTSELGKGTTVTVRLPLGKVHFREDQVVTDKTQQPERQETYADVVIPDASIPDTIQKTEVIESENALPILLLIEDNADVRSYIRSIVSSDYTLLQAVDGEDGIKQAKEYIPDLIISDVMMPKMNGYEVCRHVKKDERTSHIPVILLTAKASITSRIEGLETEADVYLNKPFVPRELLLYINNLIESRRKLRERYNRQVVLKPSDIAINSMDEQFLQRLMNVVEANFEDEDFSVEQLSDEMGMSRSQLHRKLQALTNESCSQFIRTFRLQRAMDMLKKKHASVSEIAFKVGFASHSYFNKCFLQQYGCTPSSVVEGASAESVGKE